MLRPAQSPHPCINSTVTAHPSTVCVSIAVLPYDGPLLCGFDVAVKGLNETRVAFLPFI